MKMGKKVTSWVCWSKLEMVQSKNVKQKNL